MYHMCSDTEVEGPPAGLLGSSVAGVGFNERHDLVEELLGVGVRGGRMVASDELVLGGIVRWEAQDVGGFHARPWAERVVGGPHCTDSNPGVDILGANVSRVPRPGEKPVVGEGLPIVLQIVLNEVLSLLDTNLIDGGGC